jgi:hypothetical protein
MGNNQPVSNLSPSSKTNTSGPDEYPGFHYTITLDINEVYTLEKNNTSDGSSYYTVFPEEEIRICKYFASIIRLINQEKELNYSIVDDNKEKIPIKDEPIACFKIKKIGWFSSNYELKISYENNKVVFFNINTSNDYQIFKKQILNAYKVLTYKLRKYNRDDSFVNAISLTADVSTFGFLAIDLFNIFDGGQKKKRKTQKKNPTSNHRKTCRNHATTK